MPITVNHTVATISAATHTLTFHRTLLNSVCSNKRLNKNLHNRPFYRNDDNNL